LRSQIVDLTTPPAASDPVVGARKRHRAGARDHVGDRGAQTGGPRRGQRAAPLLPCDLAGHGWPRQCRRGESRPGRLDHHLDRFAGEGGSDPIAGPDDGDFAPRIDQRLTPPGRGALSGASAAGSSPGKASCSRSAAKENVATRSPNRFSPPSNESSSMRACGPRGRDSDALSSSTSRAGTTRAGCTRPSASLSPARFETIHHNADRQAA